MRIVTKYAMLVLCTTSFIALNNCGNQTDSTSDINEKQGSASDTFGLPLIAAYPGLAAAPLLQPEVNCNDGTDNNGNGFTDCADLDCQVHPECSVFGPPLEEMVNERSLVVYPNGIITPEDIAILNARGADDDDSNGWQRDQFFATSQKDCWIDPRYMDPYFFIPLGAPLVTGINGPIGPRPLDAGIRFPLPLPAGVVPVADAARAAAFYGPRAGLINECEFGTDLMEHHFDDDNGPGAGAAGDHDDDDGGVADDN